MALCVKVIPPLEQLKYRQIMYSYSHSPLAFTVPWLYCEAFKYKVG